MAGLAVPVELQEDRVAKHVCVDPGRTRVPVSASRIRADLAGCWDDLLGPARAGLAARVVVVGAESTGTSTIAQALAAEYQRRWGVLAGDGGAWAVGGGAR